MLGDHSLGDSARILECTQLRLIAAKKGNSIILYFFCKTSAEFVSLQEMQASGRLTNVIRKIFNEILSRTQVINLRTTSYDEDFSKCKLGFRSVGAKSELEKSCDEDDGSTTSNSAVFGRVEKADALENVEQQLRDMTACPICINALSDPRMLPCIHTFCLVCLMRTCETERKKPGDKMPCPLCRKEFIIPEDGMYGVQKNFFMNTLLEFKTTLETGNTSIVCDMCYMRYDERKRKITNATMGYFACEFNYCDSCLAALQYHSFKRTDQMVKNNENCSKHTREPLTYYCAECKTFVCYSCLVESHVTHKLKDGTTVDEECRKTIEKYAWKVSNYADELQTMKRNMETRKSETERKMVEQEREIHDRNQELKDMIDKHTAHLLGELGVSNSRNLEKIEAEIKEIDRRCSTLRRFEVNCTEVRSNVSPSDIWCSFEKLMFEEIDIEREHEAFIGRPRKLTDVDLPFEATNF